MDSKSVIAIEILEGSMKVLPFGCIFSVKGKDIKIKESKTKV